METKNEDSKSFTQSILLDIISQITLSEMDKKIPNQTENLKIEDFIKTVTIKEKYEMNLVKTKVQRGGALCGFFCLFNAVNFIQFIKNEGDVEKQLYYLNQMNSTPKFWSFYKDNLSFLLNNENVDSSDIKSLKESGPLERYQFKLLIETKSDLKEKLSDDANIEIKFFPFFFAFNYIQMTKEEITTLQEAFIQFRTYNGDKNLVYVILLGITNHWSVLVIENKKGVMKFNYIDSNNLNGVFKIKTKEEVSEYISFLCTYVTNINDIHPNQEDIIKFAEDFIAEISKYRKAPSGWLKTCFIQWISDINIAVKIIFKIIFENYSLYYVAIESFLIRLIDTFEEYMKCLLENHFIEGLTVNGLAKERLFSWLNNEYHPTILDSDLLKSIEMFNCQSEIKRMKIFPKLKNFILYSRKIQQCVHNEADDKSEQRDDDELIHRFYEVLDQLEKIIL